MGPPKGTQRAPAMDARSKCAARGLIARLRALVRQSQSDAKATVYREHYAYLRFVQYLRQNARCVELLARYANSTNVCGRTPKPTQHSWKLHFDRFDAHIIPEDAMRHVERVARQAAHDDLAKDDSVTTEMCKRLRDEFIDAKNKYDDALTLSDEFFKRAIECLREMHGDDANAPHCALFMARFQADARQRESDANAKVVGAMFKRIKEQDALNETLKKRVSALTQQVRGLQLGGAEFYATKAKCGILAEAEQLNHCMALLKHQHEKTSFLQAKNLALCRENLRNLVENSTH